MGIESDNRRYGPAKSAAMQEKEIACVEEMTRQAVAAAGAFQVAMVSLERAGGHLIPEIGRVCQTQVLLKYQLDELNEKTVPFRKRAIEDTKVEEKRHGEKMRKRFYRANVRAQQQGQPLAPQIAPAPAAAPQQQAQQVAPAPAPAPVNPPAVNNVDYEEVD